MSEQETPPPPPLPPPPPPPHHNFMKVSVDSFSELPFIRSVPAHQDNTSSSYNAGPAIRLFGIDFPTDADADADADVDGDDDPSNNNMEPPSASTTETSNTPPPAAAAAAANGDTGESVRKFECHYCCRKFPTSQALGGHQNAHKRERQHAKRAHLHSAMASQHYHHHQHHQPGFFPAGNHLYGAYLNYGRHLGSLPSAARFDHPPQTHYPSTWNPTAAARFYGNGDGGLSTASHQLINGSPLPGLWRMPVHGAGALQGEHHHQPALPLFGGREAALEVGGGGGGGGGVGSSSSSSSSLASPKDHGGFDSSSKNSLSLDLHL